MIARLSTALLLLSASTLAAAVPIEAVRTLDGATFNPQGQILLVHYWATWCAPCRVEMPVLQAYYRKHHAQGLAMLAISLDDGTSTAKLKQVAGAFTFPVARIDDVKMPRKDIPTGIPVNRIYDRTGRLIYQSGGDGRTSIDAATLERVVTPLLARP